MRMLRLVTALIFTAAMAAPQIASANASSDFYGEVVHVSTENVKVYNPKTKETLSFLLTPKFDQVFSADGKTTYQMKDLHNGQYVRVIYDQKALGARHADKIVILHSNNTKANTQIPSHPH
jgi:hypothetical protein